MSAPLVALVASLFGAPGLEWDSLRLSALYDISLRKDREGVPVLWPGPGVDIGFSPWHLQYVYQSRPFGDGLDWDGTFLDERPNLKKQGHRVSASWQRWGEWFRFEVGAGWIWSRYDAILTEEDRRPLLRSLESEPSDSSYATLYWYRIRQDRVSRPLVFVALGPVPRRRLTMVGRVEFSGTLGASLSLEGNLR